MTMRAHHRTAGHAARPSDPGSDEAPELAGTDASGVRDSEHGDPASDPTVGKAFETLRARAALAGFALDAIEADDGARVFVITRWALTRELPGLGDVEAFLTRAWA